MRYRRGQFVLHEEKMSDLLASYNLPNIIPPLNHRQSRLGAFGLPAHRVEADPAYLVVTAVATGSVFGAVGPKPNGFCALTVLDGVADTIEFADLLCPRAERQKLPQPAPGSEMRMSDGTRVADSL